jgi:hypothetical protein
MSETEVINPDTTNEAAETAEQTVPAEAGSSAEPVETDSDGQDDKAVRKLRKEAETLRARAKAAEARAEAADSRAARIDTLSRRLHTELVRASGKLADPEDFPYNPDADLLDDPEAFNEAIDELLAHKSHLRARTPKGDIGQGKRGGAEEPVNLMEILKTRV